MPAGAGSTIVDLGGGNRQASQSSAAASAGSRRRWRCCGSGIDVEVYEQAPELKELGAGVQISSNGTRVLYALGLGSKRSSGSA